MIAGALSAVLAIVILYHCVCVAAHLNVRRWPGRTWRFAAFAGSVASVGGGALGVVLGWASGPLLLLAGVAGLISFDRRRLYP
jgi:hypothetical protein